ncbi:tudor domain-containing 6-like [Uranotaenia lowii]|uniref:tudor domain-containing 6-like n=1 Tax=Uranotaenia lowii TaxID=190385 RepID=UPI002478DA6D|nr:tudor domain-containing 6-like [Uranotaenia lowii]
MESTRGFNNYFRRSARGTHGRVHNSKNTLPRCTRRSHFRSQNKNRATNDYHDYHDEAACSNYFQMPDLTRPPPPIVFPKRMANRNLQDQNINVQSKSVDIGRREESVKETGNDLFDNQDFLVFSHPATVSHIESPDEFYLINPSFNPIVTELCMKHGESVLERPEKIVVGALYLVKPKSEPGWFRARLINWTKGKFYHLFCIDSGRTQKITRSNIRVLPDDIKNYEPGVIQCCLYNLQPTESGQWSPEAQKAMKEFIEKTPLNVYIIGNKADGLNMYHVDLIARTVDGQKSLRRALIYLNLATVDPNAPQRANKVGRKVEMLEATLERKTKEYNRKISDQELSKNDVFKAKITHSVSPGEFYVSKNQWRERYGALQLELTKYCTEEGHIALPAHEGMICAFRRTNTDGSKTFQRGIVLKVGSGRCEILSVDTGHKQDVSWGNIYYLPDQFCLTPALTVCCKLVDVEPFGITRRWTESIEQEFNRITRIPAIFQIIIAEIVEDHSASVALYMIKKQHDICINGLLVKKGLAKSTGPESTIYERTKESVQSNKITATCSNSVSEKKCHRTKVTVVRVVSPSEFYVALASDSLAIEMMQDKIQIAKNLIKLTPEKWKRGDLCLVLPVRENYQGLDGICSEWYRARVEEMIDDTKHKVFLIDRAHTLEVTNGNMRSIPTGLKQVQPAAIKCSLVCIGPTSYRSSWALSATDFFKDVIGKFESFAISLHGPADDDGTLPVILWGITTETVKAFSTQQFIYTNINSCLVLVGYAHLREKFPVLDKARSVRDELQLNYRTFDQFASALGEGNDDIGLPKKEPSIAELYASLISSDAMPIQRWKSAEYSKHGSTFIGIPTYIDNKGIIYLHDERLAPILDSLDETIKREFVRIKPLTNDQVLANGEPCIARFPKKELFGRGVVRKTINNLCYEVQSVDYGYVGVCHRNDLRKNIICGMLPVLAERYWLSKVDYSGSSWSEEALTELQTLILHKRCQVDCDTFMETDASEAIPCFIKPLEEEQFDVSEHLLKKNLVKEMYDPCKNLTNHKSRVRIAANFDISTMDNNNNCVKENLFEKELDDLLEPVSDSNLIDQNVIDIEKSLINLNMDRVKYFTHLGSIKLHEENDENEDGTVIFNPNEFDTSTCINEPILADFPSLVLDQTVEGFYCKLTNLVDPFNLFVYPQTTAHMRTMEDMATKIQSYTRTYHPCTSLNPGTSCLALYRPDRQWYRATIEDRLPGSAGLRVVFVDYLNKETVHLKHVMKCPSAIRKTVLRNVHVRLYSVRPNPRLREADILRKFVKTIDGKSIYAKVIDRHPELLVELYTDHSCTRLLYDEMIREKYFLTQRDSIGAPTRFLSFGRRFYNL